MYRVVPYLLVAAPLLIVLLSVAIGGCTTSRTGDDLTEQARFSGPDSRAGQQLVNELERRENRAELQRIIDEAQR